MTYTINREITTHNSMGPNPIRLLGWKLELLEVHSIHRILDLGFRMGTWKALKRNKESIWALSRLFPGDQYSKHIDTDCSETCP
jgi:hypothetical protein